MTVTNPGGIMAGIRRKFMVLHAGGRMVLADQNNGHQPSDEVTDIRLADNGTQATLTCTGAVNSGFTTQTLILDRRGV